MSLLTVQHNSEVFQRVPHLGDALKEFERKEAGRYIESLGKIFAKHGMHDDFGVCLIHRHFEMPGEQILVHTKRSNGSLGISTPWNVKNGNIANPSDEALLESYQVDNYSDFKYVVADNWYLDDSIFGTDGILNLAAFEFRVSNNPKEPVPSEDFAKELYMMLKSAGLEKVLGVISLANMQGKSSWETTPDKIKANVTVYGEKPASLETNNNLITVGWRFDAEGKLRKESAQCQGHSIQCRHCDHCYGVCF